MKTFFEKYKFQLSIIGNILGAVWAIYSHFFPTELKSDLTVYQKGIFDVFTLNQPLDSLKIMLNNKDIRKDKLNIKVFKYKLINTGDNDIEPNKYMPEVPFGIKVEKGKIIGIRVVESNDDYLKANLSPKIEDSSLVVFSPILFRRGKSVTCDLLVIHKDNQIPIPIFKGEIAGIGEPKITLEDEPTVFDWQVLMYVILTILFIFILLPIIWEFIKAVIRKVIRNIRKKKFLSIYGYPYHFPTKHQVVIAEIYSILKKANFVDIMNVILNKEKVNQHNLEEKKNYDAVNITNELIKEKRADT